MRRSIGFAFALIWMIVLPEAATGHGTDYRVIETGPVIAAEFFYSDQKPMRYAEVLIFSPENGGIEFQNGRTDQNGRFAFYPDSSGKWRITVNDGMGHGVRAEVPVDFPETDSGVIRGIAEKNTPPAGGTSKWIKIILGLSVVLNLFLGMYVMKKGNS
jgi:nickel transport protein